MNCLDKLAHFYDYLVMRYEESAAEEPHEKHEELYLFCELIYGLYREASYLPSADFTVQLIHYLEDQLANR